MSPNDADGMANSVDPDQTAPLAVWSGSALFAQVYLSENLGSLLVFNMILNFRFKTPSTVNNTQWFACLLFEKKKKKKQQQQKTQQTRIGVCKTLCPQHLLVPKYCQICSIVIPPKVFDLAQTINR